MNQIIILIKYVSKMLDARLRGCVDERVSVTDF